MLTFSCAAAEPARVHRVAEEQSCRCRQRECCVAAGGGGHRSLLFFPTMNLWKRKDKEKTPTVKVLSVHGPLGFNIDGNFRRHLCLK